MVEFCYPPQHTYSSSRSSRKKCADFIVSIFYKFSKEDVNAVPGAQVRPSYNIYLFYGYLDQQKAVDFDFLNCSWKLMSTGFKRIIKLIQYHILMTTLRFKTIGLSELLGISGMNCRHSNWIPSDGESVLSHTYRIFLIPIRTAGVRVTLTPSE